MSKEKLNTNRVKVKESANDSAYIYDVDLGKIDVSRTKNITVQKSREKDLKKRIVLQNSIHNKKSSTVDLDLDKITSTSALSSVVQIQQALNAYTSLYQDTFKQIAETQKRIIL